MRFDLMSEAVSKNRQLTGNHGPAYGVSRRQFLKTAGIVTGLGVAVGSGLLAPQSAVAGPGIGNVVPLPTLLEIFPGHSFHLQAPPFTGADSDPSTVYNFQGFAGIGFISGMVTRTNRKTGEVRELPFTSSDMRFMQGVFRGKDGHVREGTFGFVWIDVFEPGSGGTQLHDFNPGIRSNGLFWTDVIPVGSVQVSGGGASATYAVENMHMKDYLTIENALLGGGPSPRPGVVNFKVVFTAVGAPNNFDNPGQKFRGEFRNATAQMEWSGRAGDFEFQSAPLATSSSENTEIGHESNGSFY